MAVPEEKLSTASPQVLVVEDNVLLRFEIADALRDAGCTVVEAADAEEAWTYLQSGARPDLVFSDIHLSRSSNGVELAQKIAASYPDIPIILTSGEAYPPTIKNLFRFIPKPYVAASVATLILTTLKSRTS